MSSTRNDLSVREAHDEQERETRRRRAGSLAAFFFVVAALTTTVEYSGAEVPSYMGAVTDIAAAVAFIIAVVMSVLYWRRLLRERREKKNDEFWRIQLLLQWMHGFGAIAAVPSAIVVLCIRFVPYFHEEQHRLYDELHFADAVAIVAGALFVLAIFLRPAFSAMKERRGRLIRQGGDFTRLMLEGYGKQQFTIRDFGLGFLRGEYGVVYDYTHKLLSDQNGAPIVIDRERTASALARHLLTSLTSGGNVKTVLMPSASGRLSTLGVVLREEQPDLLDYRVAINKYYVFFDKSRYSREALTHVWSGNIGPLVEAAATLMADQPVASNGGVRIGHKSIWLDPFSPETEPPGRLRIGNLEYDFATPTAALVEVLWIDRGEDDCCLIVSERDHADNFKQARVWLEAGPQRAVVESFFQDIHDSSDAWRAQFPQFDCAFSNAVAIRDSQPESNIWVTELIPTDQSLSDWFDGWFPTESKADAPAPEEQAPAQPASAPAFAANAAPTDRAALVERRIANIGRALVWKYSKETSDFKGLRMRRIFILPNMSGWAAEKKLELARYLTAAMTINAIFNVEVRAVGLDRLDDEQLEMIDCMLVWRGECGAAGGAPTLEATSRLYYCGVVAGETPAFALTRDPARVREYQALWHDRAISRSLKEIVSELVGGAGVDPSAFVVQVETLVRDAVAPELFGHWTGPEKNRVLIRGGENGYRIDHLAGGLSASLEQVLEMPTSDVWRHVLAEALGTQRAAGRQA